METLNTWLAWGAAQPLFAQVFLGLLLFLAVYTFASVALFAFVIGAAWLLRSLAREPQLLATERPAAGFDPVLASRLVHVLGASLLVWLLAQTLLV